MQVFEYNHQRRQFSCLDNELAYIFPNQFLQGFSLYAFNPIRISARKLHAHQGPYKWKYLCDFIRIQIFDRSFQLAVGHGLAIIFSNTCPLL